MRVTILSAELAPGHRADVVLERGRVVETGHVHPAPGDLVVDADGGALVPGLHDHHLHLMATAAALTSVDVGDDLAGAVRAARRARPTGWLRATGYHVGAYGELDRASLDRIDDEPLRVQDHTGSTWFLNSAALDLVLDGPPPPGMELDAAGRPTGRLVRLDDWLRHRTGATVPEELGALGSLLASLGVTSLTDASATNGAEELALLAAAGLPQRLTCMTADADVAAPAGIELGPVKVLLDDDRLPSIDDLLSTIAGARSRGRAVAVHCVTRVQLVLTLAALRTAGARPGDRIEHAGVTPAEVIPELAALGLTVATQPAFVAARGDRYLADVDPDDQPGLYRLRSLLDADVPVLGSSDAPYGPIDPWLAMAAAAYRRTGSGRVVGAGEALDGRRALALYAGTGGVGVGSVADLCLLVEPWAHVLGHPGDATVRATFVGGEPTFQAGRPSF